jgi:HEAT repeat protein
VFQFTCPTCSKATTTATDPAGKVIACPGCRQHLRVVPEDEPAARPGCACLLPAVAGVCTLAGLAGAAAILLAWSFLGRGPSPDGKLLANRDGLKTELVQNDPKKQPPRDDGAKKDTPKDDGSKKETARDDGGKKETGAGGGTKPPGDGGTGAGGGSSPAPGNGGGKPSGGASDSPGVAFRPPEALTGEEVYKKLLRSCVWIYATDGSGGWTGTGVLVDRDERLVLTNEHVANRAAAEILALFPEYEHGKVNADPEFYWAQLKKGRDGKAIAARVVADDRKRDLALLKLDSVPADATAVRLASSGVSPGQNLHAVGGQPRGSKAMWVYTPGVVRQVSSAVWQYEDGFRRSATVIESTLPINQGDSGGPVVDGRGALVGVNAGFDPDSRQNSSHIDISEARDLLVRHFHSLGRDWAGPAEEQPPAALRDHVRQLVKALGGADADARKRSAAALADLGPDAREALPALLKMLRSPDEPEDGRKEAERALGEIGTPPREQMPALLEALQDGQSTPARVYAAAALGKLGADTGPAVAALVKALKDDTPAVRRNAAAALGRVGLSARSDAYPALLALLEDRDDEVRRTAVGALVQLGRPAPAELPALKRMLLSQSFGSRESRVYAAAALSEFGSDAVPPLLGTLSTDPDPDVLMMACSALGQAGVKTPEVTQALSRALDRDEKPVRVAAAAAIGQLGLEPATLAAVLKALGKKDPECHRAIAAALPPLGALVPDPPRLNLPKEAVAEVKPALASEQPAARAVAAYLLGTLGPDAAPAVPDLRKALAREKNEAVQREMACALAEVGPAARDAVAELTDLVGDPTGAKVPQTCAALALVRVAERDADRKAAYPVLAKALEVKNVSRPDPIEKEIQVRAQKALQKGKRPAAEAIALTAFVGDDADKVEARKTALHVLEKIGPAARGRGDRNDVVYVQLLLIVGNAAVNNPEVVQAANDAYVAIYKSK